MSTHRVEKRSFAKGRASFARQVGCGLLMGAADVIPGVSGGTVALVLGIYLRLVTAISRFDRRMIRLILSGQWLAAAKQVDAGFLGALGIGIVVGIVTLGTIIHTLFENDFTRPLTWAAFFGMIAASAILVARLIRVSQVSTTLGYAMMGLVSAGFACWLTTLSAAGGSDPSLVYLFVCGSIAICAMILPGISGAHILVILGVYTFVTGIIKGLPRGDFSSADLLAVVTFACGCAVGLLTFSKVLRWLLANYHSPMMAVLSGFMIGALRKVWPFQVDTKPDIAEFKDKVFEPIWPTELGTTQWAAIAAGVISFAAILIVEASARRWNRRDEDAVPPTAVQ